MKPQRSTASRVVSWALSVAVFAAAVIGVLAIHASYECEKQKALWRQAELSYIADRDNPSPESKRKYDKSHADLKSRLDSNWNPLVPPMYERRYPPPIIDIR